MAQLPDGSPGYRLQIPYWQEFFGTHWYLVWKDTFELYAIYEVTFSETPYSDQIDLQEYLDSRTSCISMRKEWMTQITDFYAKWISTAAVSKPFPIPCSLLMTDIKSTCILLKLLIF